mmetsp:Transcript_27254/g.79018  ORF Transcript_27254/g.79018 Transcript_27254/m.79018 type:complete len:238 (-) Transcript_27254:597-1310(-)
MPDNAPRKEPPLLGIRCAGPRGACTSGRASVANCCTTRPCVHRVHGRQRLDRPDDAGAYAVDEANVRRPRHTDLTCQGRGVHIVLAEGLCGRALAQPVLEATSDRESGPRLLLASRRREERVQERAELEEHPQHRRFRSGASSVAGRRDEPRAEGPRWKVEGLPLQNSQAYFRALPRGVDRTGTCARDVIACPRAPRRGCRLRIRGWRPRAAIAWGRRTPDVFPRARDAEGARNLTI